MLFDIYKNKSIVMKGLNFILTIGNILLLTYFTKKIKYGHIY